uniref:cytochrome c oxidase subunit II n=1 Tax=Aclerda takahashii TaxID=2936620 RepID=UPI002028FABB|nr:cytochrome c oxidase subunit II [Aclerda takahashii]UPO69094.1 cytochrome c oxidase subunit 2 [Aclerda takahashii]
MIKIIKYSFPINSSVQMMNMNILNDKIMLMMIMLMMLVMMMLTFNLINKMIFKLMFDNQKLEFLWTIFPMIMIIVISYYSVMTLYLNNEMKSNSINIKITGNQWFWNYNYMNFNMKFNSYMIYNNMFNFNIMETDNKMIIPLNTQIMIIISSLDVIHSWSIPSMNIKIDAIPGQINNSVIQTNKVLIMFGQCSEICGINHSFMPIMVESILMKNFIQWIKNN